MLSSHCHNNRLCKSLSSLAVTSLFDFRLICCILAILLQLYPSNCGNEAAPSHSQTGVTALTALFLFAWLQFQSISSGTSWSISSRSRITAGSLFVNIHCIGIPNLGSVATFHRDGKILIIWSELLRIQESILSTFLTIA